MVKQLLLSLLIAASCFGQAFTMSDQPFLASGQWSASSPAVCGGYDNGIIGYWKMDLGTGNIFPNDYTGNPIGGSLNNGATWVADGPTVPLSVRKNNSVQCPSYRSFVTMGSGTNDTHYYIITGDYSVTCWSKRLPGTPYPQEVMFGGYAQAGPFHFGIGIMQNQTYYGWGDISLQGYKQGPTVASIGENWTFWAMTRSGQTWTLWTNSPVAGYASRVTSSDQGTQNTPCYIYVGNDAYGGFYGIRNWNGYVADLRVYKNYALSSNEVWCLYHQYYQQP